MQAPDSYWMRRAIELSRRCPPSERAYSVGAVLIDPAGPPDGEREIANGYSRETDPHDHAEEVALTRAAGAIPSGAVLYTSLEPCSKRASRPRSCTELILAAGIERVVLAWREPDLFVDCEGVELLRRAGVRVAELTELADEARAVNAHLWR
jgi:pyrimidine deaminase RibD-like protein